MLSHAWKDNGIAVPDMINGSQLPGNLLFTYATQKVEQARKATETKNTVTNPETLHKSTEKRGCIRPAFTA